MKIYPNIWDEAHKKGLVLDEVNHPMILIQTEGNNGASYTEIYVPYGADSQKLEVLKSEYKSGEVDDPVKAESLKKEA